MPMHKLHLMLWFLYSQTLENYLHVRKPARNVHLKIYNTREMYVYVTYRTKKLFLNFVWLIYLYYCILAHPLFTDKFT